MWNHSSENEAADAIVHFEGITKKRWSHEKIGHTKEFAHKVWNYEQSCKIRLTSIKINWWNWKTVFITFGLQWKKLFFLRPCGEHGQKLEDSVLLHLD